MVKGKATISTAKIASKESDFTEIYQEFQGRVRSTLFRLCGVSALDDLVQEAFVKIWHGLERFEGRSSLSTWIYQVTRNVGIDYLRSRRPELTGEAVPEAGGFDPTRQIVLRDLITRGLQRLEVEARTVLVLHSFEGLSVAEVAVIEAIPEGTVKSRLFYARQTLREYLTKQGVSL